MAKAFKNNMSPGVPKMKGFSPKAPRTVAPMVPNGAEGCRPRRHPAHPDGRAEQEAPAQVTGSSTTNEGR